MAGHGAQAFVIAIGIALAVAACGESPTSDPPAPTSLAAGTIAPDPSALSTTRPTSRVDSTPRPTATPRPSATPTSAPSVALVHCTGRSSGTTAGARSASSRNWSGYVTIPGRSTVTCVEASWIQPKVTCASKSRSDVSIWVGIGGASSADKVLIQTGSGAECSGGVPSYNAWTEVFPREPEQIVPSLIVRPGDRIWAQVRVSGRTFTMTVADVTRKEIHTVTTTVRTAHRLTADWVVEAPSRGCPRDCTTLPLAHFAPTRFSGGLATIGGVLASIDHWSRDVVSMYSGSGAVRKAVVSGIRDGGSFTVKWRHR